MTGCEWDIPKGKLYTPSWRKISVMLRIFPNSFWRRSVRTIVRRKIMKSKTRYALHSSAKAVWSHIRNPFISTEVMTTYTSKTYELPILYHNHCWGSQVLVGTMFPLSSQKQELGEIRISTVNVMSSGWGTSQVESTYKGKGIHSKYHADEKDQDTSTPSIQRMNT